MMELYYVLKLIDDSKSIFILMCDLVNINANSNINTLSTFLLVF